MERGNKSIMEIEQYDFLKNTGTRNAIFLIRIILERARITNAEECSLMLYRLDAKSFDKVWR